jgi:hypothetical protein
MFNSDASPNEGHYWRCYNITKIRFDMHSFAIVVPFPIISPSNCLNNFSKAGQKKGMVEIILSLPFTPGRMLRIAPPSPFILPKDDVYLGNFSLYQNKTSSMKWNVLRKEGKSLLQENKTRRKEWKEEIERDLRCRQVNPANSK